MMARKLVLVGVAVGIIENMREGARGDGVAVGVKQSCLLENDKSTKMAQRGTVPQQPNS